jgi:TrmH family RNA methyltransferase
MNNIHYISSTNNQIVKMIVALHSNKGRQEQGLFIAQGSRTSTAILESSIIKSHSLFATEKDADNADDLAKQYTIPWYLVSDEVMNKISTVQSPSGLLLVAHIPTQKKYIEHTKTVVLADITDPGNAGTLIRTAAACNIVHLITIQGVDLWNPKVVQASAGSVGLVNLYQLSWNELIKIVKKESLCALVADQTKSDITTISLNNKLLVIGNEAHGINPEWLSDCAIQATIPMKGKTESFNAAVAGSIAIYLATR